MVLSRDLIISLGFTLVVGVLLFFFIKQRTSVVEEKINTLIQFVQEETAQRNLRRVGGYVGGNSAPGLPEDMKVYETTISAACDEKIVVSDDEEYSTDGSSSSGYTDSDSDDDTDDSSVASNVDVSDVTDNVATQETSTEDVTKVEQEVSDYIKSVSLTGATQGITQIIGQPLEDVTITTEELAKPIEEATPESPSVLEQIQNGSEKNKDEEGTEESNNAQTEVDAETNYSKLKVNELRDIITERGLATDLNVKTLKKKELISILEATVV